MRLSSVGRIKDKLVYDILGHIPRDRPFVFGIGLSKTGTTSLNDALEMLGYSAFHLPPIAKAGPDGTIRRDWPWWMYKFDAMTDLTVAVLHRELAELFPRARFIYTRREMESWLRSCQRHFTQELADRRIEQRQSYINELCEAFYGSCIYEEAGFRAAYLKHEAEVMALHGGKDNFLPYQLTSGAGWEPLCAFLDKPVPSVPMPVSNKN